MKRYPAREESLRHRLAVYQAQTRPLVGYYTDWAESGEAQAPRYRRIAGIGPVEQIRDRSFAALAS